MTIQITAFYMWLPVCREAACKKILFFTGEKKINEIDIRLGGADADFYACWDVSSYIGQEMEMVMDGDEEDTEHLENISCHSDRPQYLYPFRPKIHFAPDVGWHNDPNGLIYKDGLYHLYYQWNPYGVEWGNMHWGHSVSRDLLHWENRGAVLCPNETGTVYSGCAFCDRENRAGFGRNAILYYYTAAGGKNEWSKSQGNLFTQRLAWSDDEGETLHHSDRFRMEHIVDENRDPKVFYHAPTERYIMLLYLYENEFAIYRSDNLLDWKETQRLSFPGMWECPDLFELEVKGENEKKWVFWSADGYYVIGNFDGQTFTADSDVQMAYCSRIPYAAQSFSGIEGKTISVAWLRLQNTRGNYCGLMSIPAELSLRKKDAGYQMCFTPVTERMANRKRILSLTDYTGHLLIPCEWTPHQIDMEWERNCTGETRLQIQNVEMVLDFTEGRLIFRDLSDNTETVHVPIEREETGNLSVIIDQEAVEFFGNDGTIYGVVEVEENALGNSVSLKTKTCGMRMCAYAYQ